MIKTGDDIVKMLISSIKKGLKTLKLPSCDIITVPQTNQGTVTKDTITIGLLSRQRIGFQGRRSILCDNIMREEEHFIEEFKYRISFINKNNKKNSEVSNYLLSFFQSRVGVEHLRKQGIGVLKISNLWRLDYENDNMRYEVSEGFEMSLVVPQSYSHETGYVDSYQISTIGV